MLQFSLFRIPISVNWTFLLLAAFLGGGLRANTPDALQRMLVFMVAAFISILVHELGHALVGLKLGAPRAQIALHGLGGLAQFPDARFSRKSSIIVTAAGPGASIALAIVFLAFSSFFMTPPAEGGQAPYLVYYFVGTMVLVNLFWSAINLCPILPMDGGQILMAALGPSRIKTTCIISFATVAILGFFLWQYTGSLFNLIIMALLASYTLKVWQSQAS